MFKGWSVFFPLDLLFYFLYLKYIVLCSSKFVMVLVKLCGNLEVETFISLLYEQCPCHVLVYTG